VFYSLAEIEFLLPVGNFLNEEFDSTDDEGLTEERETERERSDTSPPLNGNNCENDGDWEED